MDTAMPEKKLAFSSKARTLADLSKVISSAKVLLVHSFTVRSFKRNPEKIISDIQRKIKDKFLVVRSSSLSEDGFETSNAGHFRSVINVKKDDARRLSSAIVKVIDSYSGASEKNEVLVQPLLQNIKSAGVAFTADIDTLAPYYVINFDESGSTDSITSGRGADHKTYVHFKHSPKPSPRKDLAALIETLKELERLFDFPYLDVEFAFNDRDELYIFQVRPITTRGKEGFPDMDLSDALAKIHKKITKLSSPHPNLLGEKAIYGVMPDWNPAEIIGFRPKTLAASLYKEIITDNIWAYQRDNYGYRNLRSHPLMLLYLGIPYIDVRVDFNSFIPKELDERIAKKLLDFYLNKLAETPVLHDKVEFEIVHSCFYFNLPKKLREDFAGKFSKEEIQAIENSLLALTNRVIDPESGLYKEDLKKIDILETKYESIVNSNLSLVDKIYWLIEDCKRFGTLPFAGIARSAFVATQILRSFTELDILSQEEYNLFTNSLNTVTKRLNDDLVRYSKGELAKEAFLDIYGHLRPGTYDILSSRYDGNFESYFSNFSGKMSVREEFSFSKRQVRKLGSLLLKYRMQTDVPGLIRFVRESIEGREYAKFVFTKSLSRVISLIEELAVKYGIQKEDLAHLNVKTILDMYASLDHRDVKEIFKDDIVLRKKLHDYTKAVKLPTLITDPDDVYFHFVYSEEPNFITLKSVTAPIVFEEGIGREVLGGKIIFIRSADPGYDFLFTKNIGGLVTLFGGANSHMAVRCAELGIPAVIGAGERNFEEWSNASVLEIHCLNKQVKILS